MGDGRKKKRMKRRDRDPEGKRCEQMEGGTTKSLGESTEVILSSLRFYVRPPRIISCPSCSSTHLMLTSHSSRSRFLPAVACDFFVFLFEPLRCDGALPHLESVLLSLLRNAMCNCRSISA